MTINFINIINIYLFITISLNIYYHFKLKTTNMLEKIYHKYLLFYGLTFIENILIYFPISIISLLIYLHQQMFYDIFYFFIMIELIRNIHNIYHFKEIGELENVNLDKFAKEYAISQVRSPYKIPIIMANMNLIYDFIEENKQKIYIYNIFKYEIIIFSFFILIFNIVY